MNNALQKSNTTYTNYNNKDGIIFDVIIDESFSNLLDTNNTDKSSMTSDPEQFNINNKYLLSIINDFMAGKWRIDRFNEFLFNNVKETALSLKERTSLIDKPYSLLRRSIENLRKMNNENDNNGEIGEILLYGIMKKYYSALSLVPKIFYKQNPNDPVKGADSIHITVNGNDIGLWFGESKFYTNIDNAINDACTSVANILSESSLKKEKSLIYNYSDLEYMNNGDHKKIEDEPYNKIKEILEDDTTLNKMKPYLHIPVLILYECEKTKCIEEISDEYKKDIKRIHFDKAKKYFKKQDEYLIKNYFREVKIHLILFPVPNSPNIKSRFFKEINPT